MRAGLMFACACLLVAPAAQAQSEGGGGPLQWFPQSGRIYRPLSDWLPRDGKVNRNGLTPERERLPPLRRIADPANLESSNPAIKAAAEIKQQEDLKCQKIKALRYLATVGCSCYDQDGKVTEALLAAMTDCTEDVRMATIEVIMYGASEGRCQRCNSKSCCSQEITEKLAELAYELDDKGCPVEPSARVRAAAAQAMKMCCPNYCPPAPAEEPVEEEEETPDPEVEGPMLEGGSEDGMGDEEMGEGDMPEDGADSGDDSNTASLDGAGSVFRSSSLSSDNDEGVVRISGARLQGAITAIDADRGAVAVQFADGVQPVKGSRMIVYHRHSLGRISTGCELNAVSVDGAAAVGKPIGGTAALKQAAVGDTVILLQ